MKAYIVNNNNTILFYLLTALALFPILPKSVESILMIVIPCLSLLGFYFKKDIKWDYNKSKKLIMLSMLYIIYLLSIIYTSDIPTGLKLLTRSLPLFLFPAIFLLNPNLIDAPKLYKIKFAYIISITLFLVYLSIKFFNALTVKEFTFFELRGKLEEVTKVHGTYFSTWIGFGVIILVEELKKITKRQLVKALIVGLLVLFFVYWQYVIGARMPFLATVVIATVFSFKSSKQLAIAGSVLMVLMVVLVLNSSGIGQRINKLKEYDFSFPKGTYEVYYPYISTEQIRNGIYYCSWQKIKQSWVIGYGVGDVDNELQQCYDETFTDTDTYKVLTYNSHSQYLQITLACGFAGLFLFIASIGYLFKNALKQQSGLYVAFLGFILLNFIFENILSRHDGVLFFCFFNSLLYFQKIHDNNKEGISK